MTPKNNNQQSATETQEVNDRNKLADTSFEEEIIEEIFSSSDWQDREVVDIKYSAMELKKAIQKAISLTKQEILKIINEWFINDCKGECPNSKTHLKGEQDNKKLNDLQKQFEHLYNLKEQKDKEFLEFLKRFRNINSAIDFFTNELDEKIKEIGEGKGE